MKVTRTTIGYTTVAIIALAVGLTGCGSTATPIPQGVAATKAAPAPAAPKAAPAPEPAAVEPVAEPPAPEPAAAVSTCDAAREALLTGTPREITAAMLALKADKTMDGTAREYAGYYTGRDKGNKQMQSMDESLISMSCTL